jgi:hypothetical protein
MPRALCCSNFALACRRPCATLNEVVTIATAMHGSTVQLRNQGRVMLIQRRRRDRISRLLVLQQCPYPTNSAHGRFIAFHP